MKTPFTLTAEGTTIELVPDTEYQDSRLDYTTEYEIPLMVGFGASYRFGDYFTLSADYESRAFGDKKFKYAGIYDDGDTDSGEVPMSDSNEDLNQFRVGAEFLIVTGAVIIPIRAGVKNVPTLLANNDVSGNTTGQVVGSSWSVGTGLIFHRLSIDAALTMSTFEQEMFVPFGEEIIKTNSDWTKSTLSLSGILYF